MQEPPFTMLIETCTYCTDTMDQNTVRSRFGHTDCPRSIRFLVLFTVRFAITVYTEWSRIPGNRNIPYGKSKEIT